MVLKVACCSAGNRPLNTISVLHKESLLKIFFVKFFIIKKLEVN